MREECKEEVEKLANMSVMKRTSFRKKISSFRKVIFKGLQNVKRKSIKGSHHKNVMKRNIKDTRNKRSQKRRAPPLPSSESLLSSKQGTSAVANVYEDARGGHHDDDVKDVKETELKVKVDVPEIDLTAISNVEEYQVSYTCRYPKQNFLKVSAKTIQAFRRSCGPKIGN